MNSTTGEGGDPGRHRPAPPFIGSEAWPGAQAWPEEPWVGIGTIHAGGSALVEPLPGDGGSRRVQHLHDILAGAGVDLTPGELADALWLALAQGAPEPVAPTPLPTPPPQFERPPEPGYAGPARSGSGLPRPPENARILPPPVRPAPAPVPEPPPKPLPEPLPALPPATGPAAPRHHPVFALAHARPGRGAAPVRVPGVPGLPNPLDVVRALRPLGRRVSSLHRFELDEAATAEAIADSGGPGVVLRPERARWLDLVLAVDDGIGLRVWQDTLTELTRVLGTSGIFRTVRRVGFATTPVNSAVVDGNRTAVLAVTDGVGPAWRSGAAHRTLAAWARKAPTAVLHPLPLRLWPGTALPAERLRVRSGRPAPANHLLRAYDPWLPAHLAEPLELPVPVLELGDWSLAPWASLIASHGGTAQLHVVDAAAPTPPAAPAVAGRPADRLRAFQETVSPEAYELAAHLASVDPLTLPVMRVVQSAALPGTSPSCLAEVLLSGLLRVDTPLAGFDVYTFAPEVRALLRMAVPATDARRTLDAVTAFITPRLGRAPDFPALIATRSGTLALPLGATPFAELPAPAQEPDPYAGLPPHPAERYVVAVWNPDGGDPRAGYLVADGLVLTTSRRLPGEPPAIVAVEMPGWEDRARAHLVTGGNSDALLYRIEGEQASRIRVPPVVFSFVTESGATDASFPASVAYGALVRGLPGESGEEADQDATHFHPCLDPVTVVPLSYLPGPVVYGLGPFRNRLHTAVAVMSGGAVFHEKALCGIALGPKVEDVSVEEPTMTPAPYFLFDDEFYAALGSPATDLDLPGRPFLRPRRPQTADPRAPQAEPPASAPPAPASPGTSPLSPEAVPRDLAPPPAPAGLTLDEADALRELRRAALPADGYASGTLVLRGAAGGPRAVAAAFVAEHRAYFSGVLWYTRVAHPLPARYPALGEAPLLAVLEDCEDQLFLPPERGLLVLALGDRVAGRGFREIRIGSGSAASRVDHPVHVTPEALPRPPGGGQRVNPPVRVSGTMPDQVLDDLLRMLPWLAPEVSFDLLEVLWQAGALSGALGALTGNRSLGVSWGRREVSLRDGQRRAQDARGRALAERMLLGAYGEEWSGHRPRRAPGATELARHVVALSAAVPPEDDDEYSVRLFARAASHMLQYGDGPVGVRLAERALEYAEREPRPRGPRPLAVESRGELARLAVESGVDAFLALSRKSAGSYALEASGSTALRWSIQSRLASAVAAQEAGDRTGALRSYERAHELAVDLFGRSDPLAEAIRSATPLGPAD